MPSSACNTNARLYRGRARPFLRRRRSSRCCCLHHTAPSHRDSLSLHDALPIYARRILVESAWSYRFPARQTAHMKRKMAGASPEAKAIAWKAQKRLCGRYRTLIQAGKNTKQTTVAIARELIGFIWAVVCQDMPKLHD